MSAWNVVDKLRIVRAKTSPRARQNSVKGYARRRPLLGADCFCLIARRLRAVVLVKDAPQNDQKRDQPDRVDPRTAFVRMLRVQHCSAIDPFNQESNRERQEEGIARAAPELQKKEAGGQRRYRNHSEQKG